MVLCISAGNFDPLIFVGVMSLGTINDLVIATDPFIMKLGIGNFDPLIFVGAMPLGT